MDTNPAKRRKTDHAGLGGGAAAAASAGLFRPSTFILQTAELVEQSRVDYDSLVPDAVGVLQKLKAAVESVETHKPELISKATVLFEKNNAIVIPFPNPRPSPGSQLKVAMAPPSHCNVIGSYVSRTMTRSQRATSIDFLVEMPCSLFQEKDYLNLRYFYKRAYFLAHLTKAVSRALLDDDSNDRALEDLAFAYLHDNPLLPILVATPRAASAGCKVHIIPCCPDGLFPRQKLSASKNCLRPDRAAADATANATTDSVLPATPFYNATIKADAAYLPYLKLLHHAQKTCSAFADACLLGRVWLQQRGFDGSLTQGGFGAFEWTALVALLLQTGHGKKKKGSAAVLSSSLSSTQLFKAVVQFLAATDLRSSRPCLLGGGSVSPADGPEGLDALREGTTPVLYDTVRQLNLGYKMSAWSAGALRQYARWTHQLLADESAPDQFTPTFIARANIALEAFDLVLRIRCPRAAAPAEGDLGRHGAVWDFGSSIYQTLKRALGNRASLVHLQLPAATAWTLQDAGLGQIDTDAWLTVGIVFDPVHMARTSDRGPDAEDKKEARKFRAFWGDRAELRRFQDGTITETLLWTAGPDAGALCEEIVRYILHERLQVPAADIQVLGRGFERLLPSLPGTTASAAFAQAREAFAQLEQDLRELDDLPLHVRQVAAADEALSATSLHLPQSVLPGKTPPSSPPRPMAVVLFFEASAKWPDNLAAIQYAKIAFLQRIGESLEAASARRGDNTVLTALGLEEEAGDSANTANLAFLDIVYRGRAAFRLRIHSELEEALLARQTRDATRAQPLRAASARRLAALRHTSLLLPQQTQLLATLSTRMPALGPTVRLAKCWFAAHKLLGTHFAPELVELFVLHVFLRPQPWSVPASAGPGLLRTLQFLARWDWRADPLIVDTSATGVSTTIVTDTDTVDDEGTPSASPSDDPHTRLEAWRKIDPAMQHTVLFVTATHSSSGTAFTTADGQPRPSKVAAARMTSLARAACRLVRDQDVVAGPASSAPDLHPKLLFQPSLADYDVLIHLAPRVVKQLVRGDVPKDTTDGPNSEDDDDDHDDDDEGQHRHHRRRRSVYKNLDPRTGLTLLPLPAHPVQLLVDQLNAVYGANSSGGVGPIVFFHGNLDTDHIIGALWNPQVQPRSFRINMPCSFRPVPPLSFKSRSKTKAKNEQAPELLFEINHDGILAEIARIGGAVIEKIEEIGRPTRTR